MVQRARLVAPLALAALSVVAALSLGRVVDSQRYVLPVVGAVLLAHGVGALVRYCGWPGWVLVGSNVVGIVVYVVLVLERSTTTVGLPGGDTWRAVERQLSGGWHLLRTAPAPAPATDGAILLAVLAVWCMAALADWQAFGRKTALAPIAPALVFFVWTSTLGADDTQLLLTVAFCVAAGAFVLAQNLAVIDRRRTWLVSNESARPRWLVAAALLGGGAIAFALVVAPLVPGAGSDPILDVANTGRDGSGGGHSYRPSVTPFVDITDKLRDTDDVELFSVRSPVVDYWRIAALDRYAGDGHWTLSAEGDDSVTVGLPETAPGGSVQQSFRIGALGERWLPAAYRPVAIDLPDTLVVQSSGTIVADASDIAGLRYTVASELPPLAGRPLDAQQVAGTAAAVPAGERRFSALPKSPDLAQITAQANQIVRAAGATTPYAEAQALRDYFRSGEFAYDTGVQYDDSGSAILQFLRDKRGFCVQFASAYAVMARSLGIPARVAVGFTPGTRAADGTYRVSSHDAHAWPEIYLSGLGWTHLFDPTPGRGSAPIGGSDLPGEDAQLRTPGTAPPPVNTVPGARPEGSGSATPGSATTTPAPTPAPPTLAPATSASSSSIDAWLPALLAVGALLLLAFGYAGSVLGLKRRRRARRRDAPPALAVAGAWQEALDRLHEASVAPARTQTPLDVAAYVPTTTGPATAQPLHELARAFSAARYGAAPVAPDDADAAWASLGTLERALDRDLSSMRRWRRRLDPSTLLRR